MDLQKIRVRQDLKRMVINYYLRGEITEDQSTCICDYIDSSIGGGFLPKETGRTVIPFPVSAEINPTVTGTPALKHAPEEPRFSEWYENFKDSGFRDYKYTGRRILWVLYDLRINSLEELANTPLKKIGNRRDIGAKSIEIIRTVLEKNGFTAIHEPKEKTT